MHKYGRKPPDYRKARLWLDDYTDVANLPVFAPFVDYSTGVSYPMHMNDQIGDCTIAGAAHAVEAWTKYAQGTEALLPDSLLLLAYEAVGGYVPGQPDTDQGAMMSDVLAYWQSTGIAGHKIQAYAQLRDTHATALNQALQLFGSVYLGINVPRSAEDQFMAGQPWSYVRGSQILGGHAIVLQKFDNHVRGAYTIITWGREQRMTYGFARTYIEEAWVALSPDWLTAQGTTLSGLDVATLTSDMQLLS